MERKTERVQEEGVGGREIQSLIQQIYLNTTVFHSQSHRHLFHTWVALISVFKLMNNFQLSIRSRLIK